MRGGRRRVVAGDARWQAMRGGRRRVVAGNAWWQATRGGRRRVVAGDAWWQAMPSVWDPYEARPLIRQLIVPLQLDSQQWLVWGSLKKYRRKQLTEYPSADIQLS
jgi:hypothetical protein